MDKKYYVYILRCADDSLYTGITTNLDRRFSEHRGKTGAKYTKSHSVVKIETFWEVNGRSNATKLEHKIKKLSKIQKENLIISTDILKFLY